MCSGSSLLSKTLLICYKNALNHILTALWLDVSMVSSPLAPPQTQHELKQIWRKERDWRRSIHSTRAYWSCFLHQRAMCWTTARSALFPVTGLAKKPIKIQIKPWRTCCAKPLTHAENAVCSSLHTPTSGLLLCHIDQFLILETWKCFWRKRMWEVTRDHCIFENHRLSTLWRVCIHF